MVHPGFFVDVLGDLGVHARAAFSVEQLPLNAPVELVVTFATLAKREATEAEGDVR